MERDPFNMGKKEKKQKGIMRLRVNRVVTLLSFFRDSGVSEKKKKQENLGGGDALNFEGVQKPLAVKSKGGGDHQGKKKARSAKK